MCVQILNGPQSGASFVPIIIVSMRRLDFLVCRLDAAAAWHRWLPTLCFADGRRPHSPSHTISVIRKPFSTAMNANSEDGASLLLLLLSLLWCRYAPTSPPPPKPSLSHSHFL